MDSFTNRLRKTVTTASLFLLACNASGSDAADPVPLSFKGSCSVHITGAGDTGLGNFEVNTGGNPNQRSQTFHYNVLRTNITVRAQIYKPNPNVEAVSTRLAISSPDFTNNAIASNATPGTHLTSTYTVRTASRLGVITCTGEVL